MQNNLNEIDSVETVCHEVGEIEEVSLILSTNNIEFKMLSLNIRSIQKNFEDFSTNLERSGIKFDVIILVECRINETSLIPIISGYTSYRTNKIINQNSGVVAYIRDCWNATVSEPCFREADCLIIEIPNTITIFGIYRSPSFRHIDVFLADLETQLTAYNNRPRLAIAGDININISSNEENSLSSKYLCLIAEYGLTPTITRPTRDNACLDHIFVKSATHRIGIVCDASITDHRVVIAGIALHHQKRSSPKRLVRKYDTDAIKRELSETNWLDVTMADSVDSAVDTFTDKLTTIINENSKMVKISRSKYNLKSWITPGLMRCMKHRDKLHSRSKKHPNNEILQISYKRYRNFLTDLLHKLKKQHDEEELKKSEGKPKRLWKVVKEICHLSAANKDPVDLLHVPGTHSAGESLNTCNKYFATVGRKLANNTLNNIKKHEHELVSNLKSVDTPIQSFFMQPTDHLEVDQLISHLQNEKAPGIDGLSNKFIKEIREYIVAPLTDIFNMSFATGTFPSIWKTAVVTPIHKSGPKDAPSNYRPISLLNAFSKLLEKLANKRFITYLESRNLIFSRQFGFRRGKSTEDAVALLTTIVSRELDNNQNCVGVFLDLAKAFDTVSTPILLKKLENVGIRGVALNWFKSYLTGRKQCLRVGQHVSDSHEVEFGVPQGSILGPSLFILYLNDIQSQQTSNAEIICYADDTAIIYHSDTWNNVFSVVEQGLSNVSVWLQNNLLTLNIDKTKFICFHKTRKSAPPPHMQKNLKIHTCTPNDRRTCDCRSIQETNAVKYLGVQLDQNLNFKQHISLLSVRVRKLIHIMRQIRDSGSQDTLRTVYYALCQSLLVYCNSCWGGAAKTILIELERAQRSVLKVMYRKQFRYPTTLLYKDSLVLTVRQLYVLKLALAAHRRAITSADYQSLTQKRVFRLKTPATRSTFAKRFGIIAENRVYNKALKHCSIINCPTRKVKIILQAWLMTLSYDETENLIKT